MTPEGLEKLRSVGHCQFAFASDRNLEDYVYNASDLRDLPGRKYQSKRNHINRFEAEYEYRYEPMTRDHAAECMRLEAEWRKTRSGHTGEPVGRTAGHAAGFRPFRPAGTYRWLHLRR